MAKRKKIIGIDINEVLRAYLYAIENSYMKEFGDNAIITKPINTTNLLNHYKFEDKIRKVTYLLDDENGWISNEAKFDEVQELITKDLALKFFLFEDYTFEVFSSTGKIYTNVFVHLNELYRDYRDDFEFVILAKENNLTIPFTLFFLSKNSTKLRNYKFVSTNKEIWDNCDIYITTYPETLDIIPKGKKSIKVKMPYNVNSKSNFEISKLEELKDGKILNKLLNKTLKLNG
jgi:hypothetical protein